MDALVVFATVLLVFFAGVMILGVPLLMSRTTQRPVTFGGKARRALLLLVPEAAGWGILCQAVAVASTSGGFAAHHVAGTALAWYWAGLACTGVAFAAMVLTLISLLIAMVRESLAANRRTQRLHV